MYSFNSSVNWENSDSYLLHYDMLIKRYLQYNDESDHSKYTVNLVGNHHPVITRWDYPNLQKPCRYRMKKLEKNYYKFDLEDIVPILSSQTNKPLLKIVTIQTSENAHFKKAEYFRPPIFGYFAKMKDIICTGNLNSNNDRQLHSCCLLYTSPSPRD